MPIHFPSIIQLLRLLVSNLEHAFLHCSQPAPYSIAISTVADLLRSKPQLIAENALLRQQLMVLHRQVKKPRFTQSDRLWLVLLASRVQNWRDALLILKPDTLLHWHRQAFRLFWKFKSRSHGGRPRLAIETIALIRQMTRKNSLWGVERIRGELLKLGIRVATATILKYMRLAHPRRALTQNWSVFLKNHANAKRVWACDFLPTIDLFFRPIYLFFIIELASRRVVHFGVTGSPTDAWVAQQLREATPFGTAPRFLIRDRDSKYGECFTRVATGTWIEILKTPYRAPKANVICERFLGSVRRECLDHMLVLGETHLLRVIKEYVAYFNRARPHQGIEQKIPERSTSAGEEQRNGKIIVFPVLNGLHHDYRCAA